MTPKPPSGKPRDKPRRPVGELRVGPVGGKLRNGGPNKGGPGRPQGRLVAYAKESLEKRISIAEDIADNAEETSRDRLAALAFLKGVADPVIKVASTDPDGNPVKPPALIAFFPIPDPAA